MKLWGGRFAKETDRQVDDFNSSISFDSRMYRQDIAGSLAHADMLCKCGIISRADRDAITAGLEEILAELDSGAEEFSPSSEDIHMHIEALLTAKIGDAGKRLHTGRSRNDQVALDIRLYLRDEITTVKAMVLKLCRTITGIAGANTGSVMPGYTHLQPAQPITLAHHLMAYFEMLKRDIGRLDDCNKRMDSMPLGSGALAGTTYPLDREAVAETLGFGAITQNSLDGVSDRDFVLELASALSLLMMHLSRFSEEIILWSTREFGFAVLDDAFSTGSSIMPQKKNPDVAELVRGKTGRVYGNMVALFTVMKSLPLAYNKDMQEDKEAIFDSLDTVKMCLPVFTGMLSTLRFNTERMRAAAAEGFINATDFADYLVKKGLPFRSAHEAAGKAVAYCIANGTVLEKLPLDILKNFSELTENDIYEAISLEKCVSGRALPGGPAPAGMKKAIASAEKYLASQAG